MISDEFVDDQNWTQIGSNGSYLTTGQQGNRATDGCIGVHKSTSPTYNAVEATKKKIFDDQRYVNSANSCPITLEPTQQYYRFHNILIIIMEGDYFWYS